MPFSNRNIVLDTSCRLCHALCRILNGDVNAPDLYVYERNKVYTRNLRDDGYNLWMVPSFIRKWGVPIYKLAVTLKIIPTKSVINDVERSDSLIKTYSGQWPRI
jgi:hypothetical protein